MSERLYPLTRELPVVTPPERGPYIQICTRCFRLWPPDHRGAAHEGCFMVCVECVAKAGPRGGREHG